MSMKCNVMQGSVVMFKVLEETEGTCLSEDDLCKVRCSAVFVLTYAVGSAPKSATKWVEVAPIGHINK